MAVSLVNPKLSVSDSQMAYLEEARSRTGYHAYFQFYIDSEPLMDGLQSYIDLLNHVSITTENGYVFEGHYTAEDIYGPFDVIGFEADATPKLAPGAYIEITGIADEGAE
ncbi:uncharacterized protein LOC142578091 [Dermacentor variabilis]|uniref:uncharacterized protein LOC142578091 n=1 Tax=Dermacentor variabilis TaxID=34621 RepID=UPI003F5B0AF6